MNHPARKLRNLLLDAGLQLRLVAVTVACMVVVSALLGGVLWQTWETLVSEGQRAVTARSLAADTSRDLSRAALAGRLMEGLDDPELAALIEEETRRIASDYEEEKQAVLEQHERLQQRGRLVAWALIVGLTLLTLAAGVGMLVVTHKIAGPLLRVRRLARQLRDGKLTPPPNPLRRGDQLQDVFAELSDAIFRTAERQQEDLDALREAHEALSRGEADTARARLEALEARMAERLAASEP